VFGGGGELEGAVAQPLELTVIPTDIYRSVSIPNRWHFTSSIDTVAIFVVTLNKGHSTAVCTEEV
jgi:hypothetical protein